MVGLGRLELPTSRLSGVRSNHLSYRPLPLLMAYSPNPVSTYRGRSAAAISLLLLSKLNSKSCRGIDQELRVGSRPTLVFLRKEVIQPQVPLRLPCYDFTPIIDHTLGACPPIAQGQLSDFWYSQLSWCDGRCVQGPGTYSPRHADPRLLAIPTSRSRVADSDPN